MSIQAYCVYIVFFGIVICLVVTISKSISDVFEFECGCVSVVSNMLLSNRDLNTFHMYKFSHSFCLPPSLSAAAVVVAVVPNSQLTIIEKKLFYIRVC